MTAQITNRKSQIATARLQIVPFGEKHLTPRYVGWLNDPDVTRFSEQRHHAHTLATCRAYWQSFEAAPNRFWAIVAHDPALGHIGNINAYINVETGVADVGLLIGERAIWGQGYGGEAWQAACAFLFEKCGICKITAGTLSVNEGMLHIMRRAGMKETNRQQTMFEGQEVETVFMALKNVEAPLRAAVTGCGSIGRRHLANLRALPADRPIEIAVYDADTEAAQAASRDFNACAVSCPNALWEFAPDVALICTPSHLHVSSACDGAYAGAALFIEKPVAHSLNGLDELNALVAHRNLTTLVGCNMRFHPGPAQLKQWLDAGAIGTVLSARLVTGSYLPAWRPQQDYRAGYSASPEYGGAILDCIHELDLALWLLGPADLHSALVRPAHSLGLETDGLAELLLSHEDGVISSIHCNFVQRNYERHISIVGSEGMLHWDFNAGEAVHYGSCGKIVQRSPQAADWNLNQMYRDELTYFLNCVDTHAPTMNTVADAARTLRIALQARNGGRHANTADLNTTV